MLRPGQRQPQRMKQRPALGAGCGGNRLGPGPQVLSSQGSGGSSAAAFAARRHLRSPARPGRPPAAPDPRHRKGARDWASPRPRSALADMPIAASRGATSSYGSACSSLAFSAASSSGSKCAGARPILAKSNSCASASSDRLQFDRIGGADLGEIGRQRQRLDAVLSRSCSSDSEPRRLDNASPPAPTSSGKCANCGTGAPSASKISICAAVLVT